MTVGPAPRRLPDAPPWVQATASATAADVAWQVPADAGGLTVRGYAVENDHQCRAVDTGGGRMCAGHYPSRRSDLM